MTHETDPLSGADTAAPVQDWLLAHGYDTARARRYSGVRLQLYERRA